jgi:hypothetical protein
VIQCGGKRLQEERRGCSAEFYCSLVEGVLERVAPVVFRIPQRREFPGEQNICFCSGGILFTQNTTWLFCPAGNPPPRGNPGLKRTQTDNILKKIEFKMIF